ncbi:PREDICTED: uncharacterized protein LOC109377527 [Hipposideros armiger]|uniref:Uncharacterized protein LOC109377527 n=1 Tax=Hipposideros armiger TaxID=186990 RepID=A0A8B7QLH0_HIPAR|nr:PREDICTED: uncharacterized protein LOC109377527 [Hipposideros armiger]
MAEDGLALRPGRARPPAPASLRPFAPSGRARAYSQEAALGARGQAGPLAEYSPPSSSRRRCRRASAGPGRRCGPASWAGRGTGADTANWLLPARPRPLSALPPRWATEGPTPARPTAEAVRAELRDPTYTGATRLAGRTRLRHWPRATLAPAQKAAIEAFPLRGATGGLGYSGRTCEWRGHLESILAALPRCGHLSCSVCPTSSTQRNEMEEQTKRNKKKPTITSCLHVPPAREHEGERERPTITSCPPCWGT